jgi:AcrR family transcriptional regulator
MPRQSARRHQQGEESRLRILAAAFEIASERGYDGTTLALVTKRAGLPASSVYWQFKNKDELLAAAIEHNYWEWRAARTSWTEVVEDQDWSAQVETALRHVAIGLVEEPHFQRLGLMLALEQRAVEATARVRFRKVRDETVTMMTGWWQRVLPNPTIAANPTAPQELAQLMIAVSDGLFISSQIDEGIDIDRLVDLFIIAMGAVVRSYIEGPTGKPALKVQKVKTILAAKPAAAKSSAPAKPEAKKAPRATPPAKATKAAATARRATSRGRA